MFLVDFKPEFLNLKQKLNVQINSKLKIKSKKINIEHIYQTLNP